MAETFDNVKSEKGERIQVAPPVETTGSALPDPLRHRMESAFGADFSAVRVHEGHQATMLGADAYTSGTEVHFALGKYDPHGSAGQELIVHELWHVVQQKQGRVVAKGLVQF